MTTEFEQPEESLKPDAENVEVIKDLLQRTQSFLEVTPGPRTIGNNSQFLTLLANYVGFYPEVFRKHTWGMINIGLLKTTRLTQSPHSSFEKDAWHRLSDEAVLASGILYKLPRISSAPPLMYKKGSTQGFDLVRIATDTKYYLEYLLRPDVAAEIILPDPNQKISDQTEMNGFIDWLETVYQCAKQDNPLKEHLGQMRYILQAKQEADLKSAKKADDEKKLIEDPHLIDTSGIEEIIGMPIAAGEVDNNRVITDCNSRLIMLISAAIRGKLISYRDTKEEIYGYELNHAAKDVLQLMKASQGEELRKKHDLVELHNLAQAMECIVKILDERVK